MRWERASIASGPSAPEIWPGATAVFGPVLIQGINRVAETFLLELFEQAPKATNDGAGIGHRAG